MTARPISGSSCPPVGQRPQPAGPPSLCGARKLTGCTSPEDGSVAPMRTTCTFMTGRPISGKSCPPVGRCPQPASFTPLCGVRSLTGCISMEGTLGGARATLDGALSPLDDLHFYAVEEPTTGTTSSSSSTSTTSSATSSATSSTTSTTSTTTSSYTTSSSSTNTISTTRSTTSSYTSSSSSTNTISTTSSTTSSYTTSSSSTNTTSTTSSTTSSYTPSSSSANTTSTTSSTTSSYTTSSSSETATSPTSSTTSATATIRMTPIRTFVTSSFTQTATSSTATSATRTSFVSTTVTSATDTTTTRTRGSPQVISPDDLQAMEDQRKKEAAQAVAATETAEISAVLEAISALPSSNTSTQGLLGEISIKTPVGWVKVVGLSLDDALADGLLTISMGEETGAFLQISARLAREVAAGNSTLLLSFLLLNDDASSSFKTDNVLAEMAPGTRAPAARPFTSTLQSQCVSINFWTTNGEKIHVEDLAEPVKFVLEVDDEAARCAFWDEDIARWSFDGMETFPSEVPGTILCSSTHFTIFGGVIEVRLTNVVFALKCSTFSSLMNEAAFKKLTEEILNPEWLQRPPILVTIVAVIVFVLSLAMSACADRRSFTTLPWSEREQMLMRVTSKPEDQQQEIELEEVKLGEGHGEEEHERDHEGKEKQKKESAAGGDWELPSCFRTLRGLVEGLLELLSQATGGATGVDELKEIVANAEAATINRSIEMLQSHRSGADQTTIQVIQADSISESRRVGTAGAPRSELAENDGESQVPRTEREDQLEVEPRCERWSVRSVSSEDEANIGRRTEDEPIHQVELRRGRRRSSLKTALSAAVRAVQRVHNKVQALHLRLMERGSGAAERFLNSNVFCRALILFPAAHNWIKVRQLSIVIPYSVRVSLIGMKVFSSGAFNALFFASKAPTPDADPDCSPNPESLDRLVQSVTVGLVTATGGDLIILFLLFVVKKNVVERPQWTEKMKKAQRWKWFRRSCFYWAFVAIYNTVCVLYISTFLSNVREVDAEQWLESTAVSVFQALILKPFLLAIILAIMSSLVLTCSPSIKRKIEERWLKDRAATGDGASIEDRGDHGTRKSSKEQREVPDDQTNFGGILPGAVPN